MFIAVLIILAIVFSIAVAIAYLVYKRDQKIAEFTPMAESLTTHSIGVIEHDKKIFSDRVLNYINLHIKESNTIFELFSTTAENNKVVKSYRDSKGRLVNVSYTIFFSRISDLTFTFNAADSGIKLSLFNGPEIAAYEIKPNSYYDKNFKLFPLTPPKYASHLESRLKSGGNILLSGPSGTGKTTLMSNLMYNKSTKDTPCTFFIIRDTPDLNEVNVFMDKFKALAANLGGHEFIIGLEDVLPDSIFVNRLLRSPDLDLPITVIGTTNRSLDEFDARTSSRLNNKLTTGPLTKEDITTILTNTMPDSAKFDAVKLQTLLDSSKDIFFHDLYELQS